MQCPPGLAQTAPLSQQSVPVDEATLPKEIGKKISFRGRLTKLLNGRIGIVSGKANTQISIDPLPCPTLGEIAFKFEVKEYRQTNKKPKYHHRSPEKWLGSDARRRKLDQLIKPYEVGESVELTGKLCHLTATVIGNVQKNIGYPRIPDSHYFFSVDDVTLIAANPHPKK